MFQFSHQFVSTLCYQVLEPVFKATFSQGYLGLCWTAVSIILHLIHMLASWRWAVCICGYRIRPSMHETQRDNFDYSLVMTSKFWFIDNLCIFNYSYMRITKMLLSFQKVCRIHFFSWMSEHDVLFSDSDWLPRPLQVLFLLEIVCIDCFKLFQTISNRNNTCNGPGSQTEAKNRTWHHAQTSRRKNVFYILFERIII